MSQYPHEHSDSGAFAQVSKTEVGISASPSRSGSQLILTQQPPLSPLVEIHADDTAHRLWQQIALDHDFQGEFVAAVDDLIGDLEYRSQREDRLREVGVTALGGVYAGMVPSLARADAKFFEVLRQNAQFGTPGRSVAGWHVEFEEVTDGPLAVLRESDRTPTIAVRIDDGFGELRPEYREDIAWLLAELARAVDLRIIATGRWQRKLVRQYREQLPAVSEQCSAGPTKGAIAEQVEEARDTLNPNGRKVRILRQLAEKASETLSYNELYALHQTTKGAVRQCLTTSDDSLGELGLVETFSRTTEDGNAVELLTAGRKLLDRLDTEIGRQQRLEAVVSDSGNPSDDSRVTPPAREGRHRPAAEAEACCAESGCSGNGGAGAAPNRHRLPFHHQVRSAARHRYAAAIGSATDGGITLVDHPIGTKDDRGEPHWYYDHDADRLLVGGEYDDPMQWWVCIALALANARTFRHVLTPERFETGKLGELLANHADLLRNSRCLGYLKDADATAEDYTDALLEAAEDLRELTRDLHHENYEDRNRFRGDILREAQGLAGTIVHLLDLADVDVVREARVPRFSRDFGDRQQADLAETLSVGVSIQSRYGESTAYRQLLESREDKRESAIPPTVDADDPFGELIGSFVVVGKSVDQLADPLRRRLSNQEVHEDAPEFAVPIPVEEAPDRSQTAQAVQVMCRQKSIRPTRAATSMLAALTGTPYDAARALHNLGSETKAPGRKLRLDEVRYGLSALEPTRLLSEMGKPALSRIVHALLVAQTPLVQSELADRAGVSSRSIRTYTDRLAAFDFIQQTEAGWRFTLPFHTDEERGEGILPEFVATDTNPTATGTFARDVLAGAVHGLLDPDRYADPGDPIGGALFGDPGKVIPALRKGCDWLDPWIRVVQTLIDAGPVGRNSGGGTIPAIGVEPEQASLTAITTAGAD
ncbi:hypothetical protein [Halococcus sp. PRR34]|uniref:hypothetical protein n=1 Tax=Halococcus sp. PRR34 TaxID=3020830 RepID=UPI00235F72EC|nr:hypothetical protein [Halococcus sp. PRR34]